MAASGISVDCTGGGDTGTACTNRNFNVLPGLNTLGGNNWGGVIRDDFVAG